MVHTILYVTKHDLRVWKIIQVGIVAGSRAEPPTEKKPTLFISLINTSLAQHNLQDYLYRDDRDSNKI